MNPFSPTTAPLEPSSLLTSSPVALLPPFTPLPPPLLPLNPIGHPQISSGRLPTVQVGVEARMGNKVVTHIRGLELFGVDVAALAKGEGVFGAR